MSSAWENGEVTNQSPFGGRMGRAYPTLPKGETVATFETYPEAQAAVDTLAKADFPVKELAIVGTDLTTVERVTGKLSWGRAARRGGHLGRVVRHLPRPAVLHLLADRHVARASSSRRC